MKLHAWLISASTFLTAVSVLAQAPNTLPPVIPPPAAAAPAPAPESTGSTNKAPAKAKSKHHTKAKTKTKAEAKPKSTKAKAKTKEHKKASASTSTNAPASKNSVIVLNPPAQATVKCNVLDVRGQGSFNGEIITYLKKGEPVTVLEEITLGHVKGSEPRQWSKIVMPANTAVWVDGDYLDKASMTVRARKLNIRGGPGENYSVVGSLAKDDAVKEIGKKGNWVEIASPTNAFAFVASEYLGSAAEAQALASNPAPTPPQPAPPEPTPQPQATAPAPSAPAPAPQVVNVPPENPAPVAASQPQPPPPSSSGLTAPAPTAASQSAEELAALHNATPSEPAASTPVPTVGNEASNVPRVVTREGIVHRSYNLQAPSGYEMDDFRTGVLTEYLQPPPGDKAFKTLLGRHVIVSGSEFFDPNWPRTPILHVETAQRVR